ncbi:MAG: tetratricopeptide repeat protein, partial [Candidatus Acidiferrales bacterium]
MLVCGGLFLAGAVGNSSARAGAIPAALALRGDASAALAAAQRQFNSGNYTNAIGTLQSALASNSPNAEIQYWLGRSYYELRDYDNAEAAAGKSVA